LGAEARSPFSLSNDAIEAALLTGELDGPLADYFGPAQYEEVRRLARDASTRAVRGGPRVLILPGIMGSKIGKKSRIPLFDDVYWVDVLDIAAGRLTDLALPAGARLGPLGVMLVAYLKLKLRLRVAGFDADFHPFDWRRGIDDLGADLKKRMGGDVSLVAHSMGGLVARSAIAQGGKYRRLVMLGTPNFGSFAPVEALRAVYPIVRKVGWLDTANSPEDLARRVFGTLPGLIQMLPFRDRFDGVDLYDIDTWGSDGLAPRPAVLAAVNKVQDSLADGRDDFFLIAGIEQETTTGLRAEPAEDGAPGFIYEKSMAGDGTVPLDFCRLPDIGATYYVRESHGSMANNGTVGHAVVDILEKGSTNRLPDTWSPSRAAVWRVAESSLRVDPYAGRRSLVLSRDEVRHLLDEVAAPDARDDLVTASPAAGALTPAIGPGYDHPFDQVVVGRRRQHRIDLRFARGSITEAPTRALALGVFSDVMPSGAARAVDERLDGAISDLFRRRMFGARIGEVFVLPKGRNALSADFVAFVGLGAFDRFGDQALETAAENLIRTLIRARIEEFATVLFGGGSGENPAGALQNLLSGFIRGLKDADHSHAFRRIVLCETDPARYTALKAELFRLSSTLLCGDIEITFDEETLPDPPTIETARSRRATRPDPVYLIIRREAATAKSFRIRSSILTAGGKATIVSGVMNVKAGDLDGLRSRIVNSRARNFDSLGRSLAEMVLPDAIRQVLPRNPDRHLVIVHDAEMSRIPWEVLALPDESGNTWVPATAGGISHRYAADNLSVAKWLVERVEDDVFSALLVVNPTLDLDGAEEEGKQVEQMFATMPGVQLRVLRGEEATHRALLHEFSSGQYDVIHYAGHAWFDEQSPDNSGLICHDHVPLTGAQLAALANLPSLVFFNACESARMRSDMRKHRTRTAAERMARATRAVGFAEAFMRAGVANFLGTYWPVNDAAAFVFADRFYRHVIGGGRLGDALLDGRLAVRDVHARDWADYLFYGNPDFIVKDGLTT
jgi:hypothetical protein